MEYAEKIEAHVLSVWRERREFFGGRGKEGKLKVVLENVTSMYRR